MKIIRTKWDLFRYLGGEYALPVTLFDGCGDAHVGTLESVEREDGSGHSFNVRIRNDRGQETFHFRTQD